ncbi:hypothetical protein OAN307_c37340 [Octadecabacter antarcticus 307]|uniref:EF-hand domain-containing protein n=1 Tax=Octadecabacter antarcticus 307 TaxID=391626 RepID=M9RBQ5_9RHOB|nr:hypothetical protein [Octadecabacter antarcticus]AGI69193.1 hypothetical protein OAN307_c37340 [Octadecabacter antarcticus 307]
MKTKTHALMLTGLFAMAPFTVTAQSNDTVQPEQGIEGRAVGETIFDSLDANRRATIHVGDIEKFRASVFSGMDYDTNGKVTYTEFSGWDPGFARVAEAEGRSDAYTTAPKIIFAFWDRNGDGDLTQPEMRSSLSSDVRRADFDDDGLLTRAEFIQGFPLMAAMRAAIRPDL